MERGDGGKRLAALILGLACLVGVARVDAQGVAPPPPPPPSTPVGTDIVSLICATPGLSAFCNALATSRVSLELLQNVAVQRVTVFAANDAAFGNVRADIKACFGKEPIDVLSQVVAFHIATGGNYTAAELGAVYTLTTLHGMPLMMGRNVNGSPLIEGTASIVSPDVIHAVNATVHIIDDVLVPENLVRNIWEECFGVPASSNTPVPPASTI
ncbi:hypothetical protein CBR_g48631 [Chara braunii]|uniref:FAS1 domain-containing protein n=1 Tax=Chara braunii TaxID=69332 RepID=A0A388M3F5_CHABU|nr:hypothetical protein CBR_g48631 [Chara braunii]|eukprot:GBG89022.1 hypothetical protein CBR_g48631 [Chara braunii]